VNSWHVMYVRALCSHLDLCVCYTEESKANGDGDKPNHMKELLLQVVGNLLDSRLNLNMNAGDANSEKQTPLLRGNLKARLQAKFPFALSADEWLHDHCVWTSLPSPAQRACALSAAAMCGVSTSFSTSVRCPSCRVAVVPVFDSICVAQMTRSEDGSESTQFHLKVQEFVAATHPTEGPRPVMLRTRKSIQEAVDRLKSRIEHCEADTGLVVMMLELAAVREAHYC